MEKKKFEAMLVLIVPQVVHMIAEEYQYDEITAARTFYDSKVYELLEQEETKLWHLSPLTLFNMYKDEKTTGDIVFPEG